MENNRTNSGNGKPGRGAKNLLFGSRRMNLPLGILAILILAGSLATLLYNELNEAETDTVTVNGKEYGWNELFTDFEKVEMDGRTGVRLSDIVNDTGLEDPEDHEYRVVGADGYTKTVTWDDMLSGILMKSKESYFQERVKQYYVEDVVEIEVK